MVKWKLFRYWKTDIISSLSLLFFMLKMPSSFNCSFPKTKFPNILLVFGGENWTWYSRYGLTSVASTLYFCWCSPRLHWLFLRIATHSWLIFNQDTQFLLTRYCCLDRYHLSIYVFGWLVIILYLYRLIERDSGQRTIKPLKNGSVDVIILKG